MATNHNTCEALNETYKINTTELIMTIHENKTMQMATKDNKQPLGIWNLTFGISYMGFGICSLGFSLGIWNLNIGISHMGFGI